MGSVAFYTLGCKVNQYETEAMGEIFEKAGYTIVGSEDKADVYVINTCTVTNLGDRKSRQFIRRAKRINPEAIIAVVGCYAQTAPDEVLSIEGVNIILGTNDRHKILAYVEKAMDEKEDKINAVVDIMQIKEFENLSIAEIKGKTRAYLKIQEGCNQYCAYCIIPYARGPIRSRRLEDIMEEVKRLAENGFKEIILTGIHVASYGKDLDNRSLLDVIDAIHSVEGIERIRLSSIEPTIMTHEFIKRLLEYDKVCPHFHLSLQSGCTKTLERMNRKYTAQEYNEIVDRIREYMPKVSITTDIMVGFPGETQEEFEATLDFVKKIQFSQIHVFKYSPRKGTPAAKFLDQVSSAEKNKRSEALIKLAHESMIDYHRQFINEVKDVLFETRTADHTFEGFTDNYIKVVCTTHQDLKGQIVRVKLRELKDDLMIGEII